MDANTNYHDRHVNAAFVKMLRTIGFDKGYVRGEGCYLWDGEGNKYLDLLTGWGVFALGRNHPKVRAVLRQVLDQQLPNLVRMDCSILSGLVAEKLTSHAGAGLTRVFFTNSGTETVEGALKFARCFTRRQKIIYCDHAFHGLTSGSLAINGLAAPTSSKNALANSPLGAIKDALQRSARTRAGAGRKRCRGLYRRTCARQKLRSRRRRLSPRGKQLSAKPPGHC